MPPSFPLQRALPLPRPLVLGLSFPLIVLNLWVFSSLYRAFEGVFSVFILAGVIALILNLPVRVLQRHFRLKRSWAIAVVVLAFLGLMLLTALILGPFLLVRLMGLKEALPQWIEDTGARLQEFSGGAAEIGIDLDTADVINTMVGQCYRSA